MEDILDLYQQAFNEAYPVIYMDEQPHQLLEEDSPSIHMKPSNPERQDVEFIRNGIYCIFIFTEPLVGWRYMTDCERRTRIDWANQFENCWRFISQILQKFG